MFLSLLNAILEKGEPQSQWYLRSPRSAWAWLLAWVALFVWLWVKMGGG